MNSAVVVIYQPTFYNMLFNLILSILVWLSVIDPLGKAKDAMFGGIWSPTPTKGWDLVPTRLRELRSLY